MNTSPRPDTGAGLTHSPSHLLLQNNSSLKKPLGVERGCTQTTIQNSPTLRLSHL